MQSKDTSEHKNLNAGGLGGIDIQEIKGQRWEYVLAFSFFMGWLGIDRFITGRWGLGIAKLLTFGGFGVWWMIDLILIGTENFKDSDGNHILRYSEENFALSRNSESGSIETTGNPSSPTRSSAKAIEELNDLRLKGILTEQEFNKKKAQLLEQL